MHPIRSWIPRWLAAAAALVVATLLVGACHALTTIPNPPTLRPLLTVESRGGECVDGPCGSTVVLERGGRVHSAAKPPNDLGIVAAPELAALTAAIGAADFPAIEGHPFRGECPTAYDGQELVFEFDTPGGIERIATCEVEVDFGSPLFLAVANALGQFIPLPLT
jgi:hypothetical protein